MQKALSVDIEAFTWPRDSYGLYDYESSKVHKTNLRVTSSTILIRQENDILAHSSNLPLPLNTKYLLNLERLETGHYIINPVLQPNSKKPDDKEEKLWLAVRGLSGSPKGYRLCEGDVLRLGRMKFRVKEIKGASSKQRLEHFKLSDILNLKINTEPSEEGGVAYKLPCRICLSEVFVPENPLISPCKCTGTMKYIHLYCLQMCLKSKINTRTNDCALSFSWKTMSCDLCRKPYPHKFNISGNIVELVEIPKPPERYLIIESLCKDKNSNKGLNILSFNSKNCIKLGRGHDCDLRVSDISVSRMHAQITMNGEGFYLEDYNSKFGTLIQVKRPIALAQFDEYWFQTGRSLSKISINRPWSFFCSCFSYMVSPFDHHYEDFQLVPVNTGIALSKPSDNAEKYKKNSNLLYEYNQLGFNSSYDEETSCFNLIEEVEIAEQSLEMKNLDLSVDHSNYSNYVI